MTMMRRPAKVLPNIKIWRFATLALACLAYTDELSAFSASPSTISIKDLKTQDRKMQDLKTRGGHSSVESIVVEQASVLQERHQEHEQHYHLHQQTPPQQQQQLQQKQSQQKQRRNSKKEAVVNIIAGVLGSAMGEAIIFPIDVIKTTIQSSPTSLSPFVVINRLVQERGFLGVYAGLPSPVVGSLFIKSFVFGGYEISKRLALYLTFLEKRSPDSDDGSDSKSVDKSKSNNELSNTQMLVAAFGAGIFGGFAFCPVDRVKISMQLAKSTELLTLTTAGMFLKLAKEGTLFRGLLCCVAREAPFNAAYFSIYERTRDWLSEITARSKHGDEQSGMAWWIAPVVGGFSGAVAWIISLPADVAKTHVQGGLSPSFGAALTSAYTEGAITRGMGTILLRAILKHGVTFTLFEALRPVLRTAFGVPEPGKAHKVEEQELPGIDSTVKFDSAVKVEF